MVEAPNHMLRLRKAANEMRRENQNGWPLTCDAAADEIESLQRQIAERRAQSDRFCDKYLAALKRAEAAEAENARLRSLPLKDEVGRKVSIEALEHGKNLLLIAEAIEAERFASIVPHECARQLRAADEYLVSGSRLRAGEQEGCVGLSEWAGWDKARDPWGETKHKDAVLEALFRGPWSVEDAAALIGFIDRTWTMRPAAPSGQGGDRDANR